MSDTPYIFDVSGAASFEQLVIENSFHKPVLVDFTADWCTTCKSNEKVMKNPEYAGRLGNLTLIKADITDYNDASRDLMQRFNVVGPPTLMFLEAQTAKEQTQNRIIGELTPDKLDNRLQALGL